MGDQNPAIKSVNDAFGQKALAKGYDNLETPSDNSQTHVYDHMDPKVKAAQDAVKSGKPLPASTKTPEQQAVSENRAKNGGVYVPPMVEEK